MADLTVNSAIDTFMAAANQAAMQAALNITLGGSFTTTSGNTSITGGGTIALGGFTLTIPTTGTAALLGAANVFTSTSGITINDGTNSGSYKITGTDRSATLTLSSLGNGFQIAGNGDLIMAGGRIRLVDSSISTRYGYLFGVAADHVGLTGNGGAEKFSVYGTTNETNYERFTISTATGASYTVGTQAGGTGTLRGVNVVGAWNFTSLQTITQATANEGILTSTGYSLTGSNATSMIDLAGTWNTSGAPTAFKLNITRTAAAATSLLLDLQQNSVSAFNVLSNSVGNAKISLGLRGANIDTTSDYNLSIVGYFGALMQQNSSGINCIGVPCSIGTNADVILTRKATATLQLGQDAAGVTNQMLTAASRITSDGVGADLTLAGGNGRGGAGGSLIFKYYTTAGATTIGTLTEAMRITTTGAIILAALPTSDPGVSGQLYKSAGVVMQSP